MRVLFLAIALLQSAHARVDLLRYELGLKRRGELIAQRYFERTRILMGIDPETCRAVTDPVERLALLKRQIQIVRTIGELNHCEHLVVHALQKLNSELAGVPLPASGGSGFTPDRPSISSGKSMSKEFNDAYLSPSGVTFGRKDVDPLFKAPSPTEFASHKMSQEGMHALRVFYSSEQMLKPLTNARLKYPLLGNETFYHYPECRIIVSGGLEMTSVIASDPLDAGHNQACAEACDTQLNQWLTEKKPTAYLMTCHHLGEIVSTRSKGTPAEQGIKQLDPDGRGKHLLGTCAVRVRNGDELFSGPVVYKAECLARYKQAYLEFERKLPLVGPDGVTQHIIDGYLLTEKDTRIATATINAPAQTDFKSMPDGKCHAEDIILQKNGDRSKEVRAQDGDCVSWCLADFRAFRSEAPSVDQPGSRGYGSTTLNWQYRCTGKDGDTVLLCSQNRITGCR